MANSIQCLSASAFLRKHTANALAFVLLVVAVPLGFLTITLIAACLSLFWTVRWLYEADTRA